MTVGFFISIHFRWNPQVEKQAINRAHRLGQRRPVEVVRLTVQHTVEQKMIDLQKKKAQLASDLLTEGQTTDTSRLGLAELKIIFS